MIKTGRTHLQDATPIRLGQEFKGYAGQVEESIRRAESGGGRARADPARRHRGRHRASTRIRSTRGLTAARLAKVTGVRRARDAEPLPRPGHPRRPGRGARRAAHDRDQPVEDRLGRAGSMGTGPIAGLGELRLPETQPGSSIMPGKVNPVIVESLLMVDRPRVRERPHGRDQRAVGQPLRAERDDAGRRRHDARVHHAARGLGAQLLERCIEGLQATDRGPELVERSPMLATALEPRHRLRRGREDRQGVDPHGQAASGSSRGPKA